MCLKTEPINKCHIFTDDEFVEEAEDEEVEAAKQDFESELTSKPKKPFQTKPKPPPKPQCE